MTTDFNTSFLQYYIYSLHERTRNEKKGVKFGFDWVIYNLALSEDLNPYRLSFIRNGPTEISKTKTENEFGVDLSFLSHDKKLLVVFVLKDEILKNSNWHAHRFENDIRDAASPNLNSAELKNVEHVKIILAYNKDEDQKGIQLYENLISTLGTKIYDMINLSFERWNLTSITDKVKKNLLTPSFLPQKFFSLFSYISAQFSDFYYGSEEWTKQLIPNWRRLLHDLLHYNPDERSIRLIPVIMIILRQYGNENPSQELGWLDLVEWAMLDLWEIFRQTKKNKIKVIITEIWVNLYLNELDDFYKRHSAELAIQHSLEIRNTGSFLDAIKASVIAHWHIGRLGILFVGQWNYLPDTIDEEKKYKEIALNDIANCLVGMINANPATLRPLLDINHIEIFLIWVTLYVVGRTEDIYSWLIRLNEVLYVRRTNKTWLPFIEGGNSLELIFEFLSTMEKPPEFDEKTSSLLLCILELCFTLKIDQRDELLALYYRTLVINQTSSPLQLQSWIPPKDWISKIFKQSLAYEGEIIMLENFNFSTEDTKGLIAYLEQFISKARVIQKMDLPKELPLSALILSCLKYRSPLPPEFWRLQISGELPPNLQII